MEHGRGRTLVYALRQELIQQLQALGLMPSAYSCESATPSCQLQRDLRVSVDAVAVSNGLHSCSYPQATLKIRHIRSLDYRPRQHSCLIQGLRVYNNLDSIVWYNIQHSPGQGSSLQVCVSDPGQGAPPFAASVRTVLICVPPPQVTLQAPNSLHTQSTANKKLHIFTL